MPYWLGCRCLSCAAKPMSWGKNSWPRISTKFISTTGWKPTIMDGSWQTMTYSNS